MPWASAVSNNKNNIIICIHISTLLRLWLRLICALFIVTHAGSHLWTACIILNCGVPRSLSIYIRVIQYDHVDERWRVMKVMCDEGDVWWRWCVMKVMCLWCRCEERPVGPCSKSHRQSSGSRHACPSRPLSRSQKSCLPAAWPYDKGGENVTLSGWLCLLLKLRSLISNRV